MAAAPSPARDPRQGIAPATAATPSTGRPPFTVISAEPSPNSPGRRPTRLRPCAATPGCAEESMNHDIKDLRLAAKGRLKIEWAARFMPVLESIKKKFAREKPLRGVRVSACLHVTTETANLMETLKLGGGEVGVLGPHPP